MAVSRRFDAERALEYFKEFFQGFIPESGVPLKDPKFDAVFRNSPYFNSPFTSDDLFQILADLERRAREETYGSPDNEEEQEEEVNLDQSGLEPEVPVLDNETLRQVDFALRGFENTLKVVLDDAGVDNVSSEQILNSFAAAKQNQIDFLPDPDDIQKELESQALAGGGFGVKVSNGLDDISILLGVPLIGGTDPLEIKLKENGTFVNVIQSAKDTARKVFEDLTSVPQDILDEIQKVLGTDE